MSTNERDAQYQRDTHFQGLAKLSYSDLKHWFRELFNANLERNTRGAEQAENMIKLILTRNAYDLVFHIFKNADSIWLYMAAYQDIPSDDAIVENMKHLPDITQRPTIELTPDLPPELAE